MHQEMTWTQPADGVTLPKTAPLEEVPIQVAGTLEHIVGQLDILTQVGGAQVGRACGSVRNGLKKVSYILPPPQKKEKNKLDMKVRGLQRSVCMCERVTVLSVHV